MKDTQILRLMDRVELRTTSKIDGHSLTIDKYNPEDTEGVIISLYNPTMPEMPYIVLWDNGYRNSYTKENLQKI